MPTTQINALRYPASTAAPNIPQDMQNLASDLDARVVPKFANNAARDAAIPSPTEGMVCHVGAQASPALPARLMVYSAQPTGASAWRLVGPSPLRAVVAAWSESAGSFGPGATYANEASLTFLTMPDPGFPYRMSAVAHCELGATATGTRWDLRIRVTGGGQPDLLMDYNVPTVETVAFQRIVTNVTDQIWTGSCTISCWAVRAYGTATGQITALNRRLHASQHAA